MIEENERRREQFITAYTAHSTERGLETTRDEAEYAFAFMQSDLRRLQHLPMPERRKQSAINYGIHWYREKTGKSEEEARADMHAGVPGNESEAAQEMIRQQSIQPPRLKRHTDAFAAYIAGLDSRIPEFVYNDE